MVLAPVVRERKGEYGQAARGDAPAGLRPRGRRRRAAPPRRGDRARQALQARHRDRDRPAGHEGGPAQAPRGVDRGGLRRSPTDWSRSSWSSAPRAAARSPGRRRCRGRAPASAARCSSSARSSPASTAAPRCPRSSRGSSPSTPRTAPASAATASASSGSSIPSSASPTRRSRSPRARCRPGWARRRCTTGACVEAVCENRGIDTDAALAGPAGRRPADPARGHRRRAPPDHLQEPLRAPAQLQRPASRGSRSASSGATRTPTRRRPGSGSRV